VTETEEQKIIVKWFRSTYPEYRHCLRVSMAGMNLGSGKRAAQMVNHMHSMGVEQGEADIAILLRRGNFGALIIEHKAESQSHKATDEQVAYLQSHNSTGNLAVLTRGIEACKSAISDYMARK